jgi:hypothetical protein
VKSSIFALLSAFSSRGPSSSPPAPHPGSTGEEVRGYLRSIAKSTWKLVNWLTHARNAGPSDASMAVEATQNVLRAFGGAIVRRGRGILDRCPACSSY